MIEFRKILRRTELCLSDKEHWLPSRAPSLILIPISTEQLTTVCNPIPGNLTPTLYWPPQISGMHVVNRCRKNIHTHKNKIISILQLKILTTTVTCLQDILVQQRHKWYGVTNYTLTGVKVQSTRQNPYLTLLKWART